NKPAAKPADLKGMKIRMMGNPLFVETMNAMGGNGVAMGFNELFSALQTGVVDGAENNPPTLLAQNHYQVSKIYSLTGHLIIPEIFVFSKRTWESLSKEDQALTRKLSREAQIEQRQLWDAYVGEAEAKLKTAGIQFVPADKEAFYKATQPVRDKYGAKYSSLIQKIRMMGNPIFVETMNAMGGNGISMGFNELYTALQTGVVDGAENNPPTLLAQNHYQVSKVYSLTGHLIIPEIFVFSKRTWESLGKADQELLRTLSREAQFEQRKLWDAYVGEAEAKLKAAGIQFVQADKAAFYQATQPVRDKYGAKYASILKRIQDTR
ncbi:MAG: TRAP transporter substrate-binding protein DctP, partial [Burkholderiales bacterium]